ncbi:MAG: recombinase family protein [Ruminococcus sp.]
MIRDIFQLYLRGMGYDYIQKSLKQKGYQTANGNDFSKSAINSILKNQKYMGTYVYDRTESKDSEGRRNSHKEKATIHSDFQRHAGNHFGKRFPKSTSDHAKECNQTDP